MGDESLRVGEFDVSGRSLTGYISSALCGFLLSLTPLSCDLMGWRGAGGNGAASTGQSRLSYCIT